MFLTSMVHNAIKYFMKGAGLARKAGPTAAGMGVRAFVELKSWPVRRGDSPGRERSLSCTSQKRRLW
ncbi:MAG: hypothetical protein JRN32_02875 [Nitrososphaerota archaeon]|nr:hypothetical protein [Nitrososphaerota archaeon]MDG7039075.1 hypothetical protein [Nitrososphaerota archaeon]MDG7040582.1 hypothetical protein [Nitrososphaerota archaeon]MDG7045744.1 hypothetical protein [Nitrososphaerota archaeon]MDG7048471.1 hypothetical protein [Nitrososphaerota archaeon]